jgi:hypothetical protein
MNAVQNTFTSFECIPRHIKYFDPEDADALGNFVKYLADLKKSKSVDDQTMMFFVNWGVNIFISNTVNRIVKKSICDNVFEETWRNIDLIDLINER